ncbi:MAG: FKBP-type peptidyl-prolyl cis-trans isomerase SlyD [Halioglobus sp.]|jgi:FKBP-type peptidyl-prolyl cis-trans isomerase SlyD
MKITPNTVVSFHYSLYEGEEDQPRIEVENSHKSEPTTYLHGTSNIIAGLETVLEGKSAGDAVNVSLAPHEAYGLRDPGNVQRVPMKHLVLQSKGKQRPKPGMLAQLKTSEGMRSVTIIKAGRHSAEVDTNHPLAGKTVHFEIEIDQVRAASEEEVAHGHAHGPGGHQH